MNKAWWNVQILSPEGDRKWLQVWATADSITSDLVELLKREQYKDFRCISFRQEVK